MTKKKVRPRRKADIFHDLPPAEEEVGEEPDFRLRWLYFVLGGIVVASVVSSAAFSEIGWVDRYSAELATEALGILLTLLFVQRFLERQERARRLRGSIGALRKGSRALSNIARTWADLLRDCMRRVPAAPPKSLTDLFAGHFTEELAYWEPRSEHVEEGDAREPCGAWAMRRFTSAQEALNEIMVTYGGALDPAYVEAIDELVDDPFLRIIGNLTADETLEPRDWRLKLNAARAYREAHFHRLLQTISIHNELANEAGELRSRRTAPRTGSVGLRLPLDHDLKVNLEIDSRWWWARSVPGAPV